MLCQQQVSSPMRQGLVISYMTLGMLIPDFWQTGFQLLKTGFKPVFSLTGLHKNLNFKPGQLNLVIYAFFGGHI